MPEERKYAYKIQNTPESFIGIMYHLGSYYVAAFVKGEKGVIARTLRKYKTLRGAEMFLLKDYPKTKRDAFPQGKSVPDYRDRAAFVTMGVPRP